MQQENNIENGTFRCVITFKSKHDGRIIKKSTKTYDAIPTARAQATRLARLWKNGLEWQSTVLQRATWVTIDKREV